ncbi:MAG: hypothetical protein FJY99_01155 [Candidatus Sericytochromatia bacterium]|nr:hypothetical protein [Candidatus Tanganyikabacteria bacterium]
MSSIFGPRKSGSPVPIPQAGNATTPAAPVGKAAEEQAAALAPGGDVNALADLPGRTSGLALPEAGSAEAPDIEALAEGALRSAADLRQYLEVALGAGQEGVSAGDDGSLSATGPALEMMGLWTGTVADDRSLASLGIVDIRLSA